MNSTNAPVFQSVAPHFTVSDVVAASKYYSEVLGFRSLGFFGTPPVFATVERGGVELHFNQSDAVEQKRPRARVAYDAYIRVTGLDQLHKEIAARGATILEGPVTRVYGMREVVIEDCHGLRIAFGEDPGE